MRAPAIGRAVKREQDRGHGEWYVEIEDRAPRHVVGQVAAEHRTGRHCERAVARPGADRAPTLALRVGRAEQREARGDEEGGAHALKRTGGDERGRSGREPAQHGRRSESDHAGDEDAAASEPVRARAADQHQRPEHEQVGVHHPLRRHGACREVPLDRGQRYVHDRAVDKREARAEHRGGERTRAGCLPDRDRRGGRRLQDAQIARAPGNADHGAGDRDDVSVVLIGIPPLSASVTGVRSQMSASRAR